MHTHSLADYMACVHRGDWRGVGELMLASGNKLAAIGAEFLICPDNTFHQGLPYIEGRSPLPWLHIADVVVAEAAARRFRRLGILGTRWLVESSVYPDRVKAAGLDYVLPDDAERAAINRIIMDELVCSVFTQEAVTYHQRVIARLRDAGCDAVVLGYTEIPLIISDTISPLPTLNFDTAAGKGSTAQSLRRASALAGVALCHALGWLGLRAERHDRIAQPRLRQALQPGHRALQVRGRARHQHLVVRHPAVAPLGEARDRQADLRASSAHAPSCRRTRSRR